MRTRTRENKKELPMYLVVILIILSTMGLLLLVAYYITFQPVPYPLEPLKGRVLIALQMEEIMHRDLDMVVFDKGEGTVIRESPEEEGEVIREARTDVLYRKLEKYNGWVKIRRRDGFVEGWVKEEFVRIIGN